MDVRWNRYEPGNAVTEHSDRRRGSDVGSSILMLVANVKIFFDFLDKINPRAYR